MKVLQYAWFHYLKQEYSDIVTFVFYLSLSGCLEDEFKVDKILGRNRRSKEAL
jgi:hypothetical protein